VEKEALKILVQLPDVARTHAQAVGDDHFTTERYRKTWVLLRDDPQSTAGLAGTASDRGQAELIAEVAVEPLKGEASPEYAKKIFARLEELSLKRRIDTMKKRLEALNPVKDADAFDPLFQELMDVTGRWRDAMTRAGEGA
jgi:DNA primase